MAKTIEQLKADLSVENDGSKFSRLKDKLTGSFADTDRESVIDILMEYAKSGKLVHWRNFLLTDIIGLVQENENRYAGFFEWTITQPALTYWGIDGLLKTKGQSAYPAIIDLVQNESLSMEIRAKATKSLAVYSKQPFDRDLPRDPGYWKAGDLRIPELVAWQQQGYKAGGGYREPQVHPSLENPVTEIEKVVAELDKKLACEREQEQDLSNPSNWLVIADADKIREIEARWTLPGNYLAFLKNYSPLNVFIDSEKFFQGLSLYGAGDLIDAQNGYATNGLTGEALGDWPANYVVIADAGADPYCIDTGNTEGDDAPVYTGTHGAGAWEFEKYADSFIDFLKELTRES